MGADGLEVRRREEAVRGSESGAGVTGAWRARVPR